MRILFAILILIVSCSNDSKEELCKFKEPTNGTLKMYNSAFEYNCGLEETVLKNDSLIQSFCEEVMRMEKLDFFTSTNLNYWYVEVKFDDSNWTKDYITLVNTQRNGFVFKIGTAKYRNDRLAAFIVNQLRIRGTDETKPCDAQ